MRISLNWPHVLKLGRFARFWLAYFVTVLVMAWAFRGAVARPDEIVFLLLLPWPFVAAYALLCLALAWVKLILTGGAAPAERSRPRRATGPWGRVEG